MKIFHFLIPVIHCLFVIFHYVNQPIRNVKERHAYYVKKYQILPLKVRWLISKGVKKNSAQSYIASLFIALSESAYSHSNKDLSILVKNSQTPGGLNEQAVRSLRKLKFYSSTDKTLNEILKRLKK